VLGLFFKLAELAELSLNKGDVESDPGSVCVVAVSVVSGAV
jgi:hypothetical protein